MKAVPIISDTTVRKSAVDQDDLYVINEPLIYKLFKYFINQRKKTNRVVQAFTNCANGYNNVHNMHAYNGTLTQKNCAHY